jgi:hypothetical protein
MPGGGKGRYYTTDLPSPDDSEWSAPERSRELPPYSSQPQGAEKYVGRASVGPHAKDSDPPLVIDLTATQEWSDPLDDDGFDLSRVTIDLRPMMRNRPPETYFERYSSKVPGHQ